MTDASAIIPTEPSERERDGHANRTDAERDRDLAVVAKLYLQGKSTAEILREVNKLYPLAPLTWGSVKNDIQTLHRRWVDSSLYDFNAAKMREADKWCLLETTYWELVEKMMGKQQKSIEIVEMDDQVAFAVGRVADVRRKTTRKKINEVDYDKILKAMGGIERCITNRCKLLGLEAPKQLEIFDWRTQAERDGVPKSEQDLMLDQTVRLIKEEMMKSKLRGAGNQVIDAQFSDKKG